MRSRNTSPDTNVHLIRHAESEWNANSAHIIGGRSNETPLSDPIGILQAIERGLSLKRRGITPRRVYVTPAIRTRHTAELSLGAMGSTPRYH
ncbi:MAG: phosphoglycerate mutase family protein [Candidatus Saccharimonadales bacterium]